jgi:hypothetical protein
MLIFKSSNIENVLYAIQNGLWQVSYKPRKVKGGERMSILVIGTPFVIYVGRITGGVHKTKKANWPIDTHPDLDEKYTIYFEKPKLAGQWPYTKI